jgi:hypothetical protein
VPYPRYFATNIQKQSVLAKYLGHILPELEKYSSFGEIYLKRIV